MYDEETVDIYKKFTKEHYKISSYLLTTGANAFDNNLSAIRPVAANYNNDSAIAANNNHKFNNDNNPLSYIEFPQPTTYSYLIGSDILVHPVVYNSSLVRAVFPDSNEVVFWLNWWDPVNKNKVYKSGDNVELLVALDSYPVLYCYRHILIMQLYFIYQFIYIDQ